MISISSMLSGFTLPPLPTETIPFLTVIRKQTGEIATTQRVPRGGWAVTQVDSLVLGPRSQTKIQAPPSPVSALLASKQESFVQVGCFNPTPSIGPCKVKVPLSLQSYPSPVTSEDLWHIDCHFTEGELQTNPLMIIDANKINKILVNQI